jgi:hypothetical protein
MKIMAGIALVLLLAQAWAGETPAARWTLDGVELGRVTEAGGRHHGQAHGALQQAPGAEGQSLVFDGATTLVTVPAAPEFSIGEGPFTLSAWVCPYALGNGQQMIAAKNNYAADQREWGLMIDKDDRFRFYTRGESWKTLTAEAAPVVGQWQHVAVTVESGLGRIYVNGRHVGQEWLAAADATDAPLSLGGVLSGGKPTQLMRGALDEVAIYRAALSAAEIASLADKKPVPHKIPVIVQPVTLWSGGELPKSAEIPALPGVAFHVIKKQRPDTDGCRWTLGVGLAWHKGKLYASYGFNKGSENTPTEEAHMRVSADGGKTWGAPVVMDHGEGNLGVSHGVFLSHKGRLWGFMGAFYDKFQRTHTRAYTLNEATGAWEPHGVVVDAGFWPMQEPQKMADGNWVMAGARVDRGDGDQWALPAVAVSRGEDFTRWDLVVIPAAPELGKIWGESTVLVEGKRLTNISRYGAKALALVSFSEDFGRTWTSTRPSNLPMATSKPYAGTLSTGQRYLVCTTTGDTGGGRSPLTLALGKPGEATLSRVFVIRRSVFPEGPGVSDPKADFSYPYAVEHEGMLYVGYTHKSHAANELAVIPLAALQEPEPVAIWSGGEVPESAEAPVLKDVAFRVIKPYEFAKDGYRFLHGVALCFHKDKLYASFGHNKGGENTDTEEARVRVSDDGGATWGPVTTIDPGDEPGVGVSHGVFLSHGGRLWAFHGAYSGTMGNVHTRAYVLNEADGTWARKGTVVEGGFWPLQEPLKMADGNWIIAGARVGDGNPAAVAISRGDDVTRWDLKVIPKPAGLKMWGESAVFLDGTRVINIARCDGKQPVALVAVSEDFGRTWGESRPSNLPMAASKPYAGTLSTGQHYLIGSTTADGGNRRHPLTIALTRPGESTFSQVFVIRHAQFPEGPGESHARASLAYPYALEHNGKLYVGYSNSGGGVGRVGEGRELWNNNSAELAVIPVRNLRDGAASGAKAATYGRRLKPASR